MVKEPAASKYIEQLMNSCLPRVLMLTHAMEGGVARHLTELSDSLHGYAHVLQLKPSLAGRRSLALILPELEPEGQNVHLVFNWPEQKEYLWRFLAQLRVSQIHVHHVLNWPSDFWDDFLEYSPSYDLTLHDHCIFSGVSLHAVTRQPHKHWLGRVQRCFSNDADTVQAAKLLFRLAVNARRVIVPSMEMKAQLQFFFEAAVVDKLEYHPHPEAEHDQVYPSPWMRGLMADEPLRILCLGMLSAEKGAGVLAQVAREAAKSDLPLEFHLLGSCHVVLPNNVVRHGSYKDEQLTDLFKQLDPHVLWLPAQCPETWSYTLSAGLKAGLPVVATNLGVFPERLRLRPLSWLCDVDFAVSQWMGVLLEVREQHSGRVAREAVWRYRTESSFYTKKNGYLLGTENCFICDAEPLTHWQVGQLLVQGLPEAQRWRESILHVLLRLKYSSLMAPIVRIIPYSWQRRVKRLISRAPLHDLPR